MVSQSLVFRFVNVVCSVDIVNGIKLRHWYNTSV